MSQFENVGICPYTGLRSFTEDESLYFKGRDIQVDQITSLLEQNKFLMVTGASGEGKSSLIYAGLIPNARAGFFKASFTNWVIVDFRPERSPVKNMAESLSGILNRKSETVETEIRRGYSSVVDLYKNSEFYIQESEASFADLPEPQRKEKKRKAANLMILVDQFEEFFTNPENFFNEIPSQDSQIVVNLVLETARLAIQEGLPIYIVCTMRSDYIGQCSAFRGLPEYIGFSQFFVPRLKRKDLKQVIEEPAILSGNKISQRLVERLVFDISEGVDQLPILQHALSQIWLMADHGKEQMDLVHYAMLGGMPEHELPDEDQPRFQKWFNTLPDIRKKYYQETGLNKVIEIHASMLYENAWEHYNQLHPDNPISQHDAKRIIVNTFCCLTKIDNSRAVRNRMSLGEITEIINTPEFSETVVGDVINIFREEGNSFIRPFKTENVLTHNLSANTVLDITHESLIRNWTRLNTWANKEFEYYSTYLDFKKQLERWRNSGKSSNYLLPIGPLTFFEKWYTECKPNTGWIKRYGEIKDDQKKAEDEANAILADIREFLKRSARNVMVTRAFIKYGPQRLATILAIFIMLMLSGFYWYDAEQKNNDRVIEEVRSRAKQLLASAEIASGDKAGYLFMEERLSPGAMLKQLSEFNNKDRIGLALEGYKSLLEVNKKDTSLLKHQIIAFIESNLKEALAQKKDYDFLLENVNKFNVLLSYDNYYNPNESVEKMLKDFASIGYVISRELFLDKKLARATVAIEMNLAIQYWLTFSASNEKINDLIKLISPLSGDSAKINFDTYYPKGSRESNGRGANDFNGGYHTLASLYAAVGDAKTVQWCFEQIILNGQKDYYGIGRMFNNYTNIIGYMYQYGHQDKTQPLIEWLSKNDPADGPISVYRNIVIRSGYLSRYFPISINRFLLRSHRGYFFPNLCFINRTVYSSLVTSLNNEIQKVGDAPQRNFLMAMSKKRQALFEWKYNYDRGLPNDQNKIDQMFGEALSYFKQVDGTYLDEITTITIPYSSDGVREKKLKRKHLFIYPDYMDGWFSNAYHSDVFFNYLLQNKLLAEFYTTQEDLEMIHWWIAKAFELKPAFFVSDLYDNHYQLPLSVLTNVSQVIESHPQREGFDANLIYLVTGNRFYAAGDTLNGKKFTNKFDKSSINRSRARYDYLERNFLANEVKDYSVHMARYGNAKEGIEMAESFAKDSEKAFAYHFMAKAVYQNNANPDAFLYLDSAVSKIRRMDISAIPVPLDPRICFVGLLSQIGGESINAMALDIYRDFQDDLKPFLTYIYVDGIAAEGNYYRAYTAMPPTLTEEGDLLCFRLILWEECKKQEREAGNTRWRSMDQNFAPNKLWAQVQYFQPF